MAGRKKKYTTEILENIIDAYFDSNRVIGQVTATDIANFAIDELGYKEIKYFHFTRNKEVKDIIESTNRVYQSGHTNCSSALVEFNSDRFLETYKRDEKTQRVVLRQFADRHNELNQKVLNMQHKENQYKLEVENLQNQNKKLKEKNKDLIAETKKVREENSKLQRFRILDEQIKMREYLQSKSLLNDIDEENLMIILEKSGFSLGRDTLEELNKLEKGSNKLDNEDIKDLERNNSVSDKNTLPQNIIPLENKKSIEDKTTQAAIITFNELL